VQPFEPRFYQAANRPRAERSALELTKFKNLYFETALGTLGILGSLLPLGAYEEVAGRADVHEFFGMNCRILALDDLIAVKVHAGRPKDRITEVELRAIRDLKKAR